MKTRNLLSFVFFAAFAVLAQTAGAVVYGIVSDGVKVKPDSVKSYQATNCTFDVSGLIPSGMTVTKVFYLKSVNDHKWMDDVDYAIMKFDQAKLVDSDKWTLSKGKLTIEGELLSGYTCYGIFYSVGSGDDDDDDGDNFDYTIVFNANGGSGTMDPMEKIDYTNTTTTLTKCAFTKTGYKFDGWTLAADNTGTAFADESAVNGEEYGVTKEIPTVTLYVKWKEWLPSYQVAYDANGGNLGRDYTQYPEYGKAYLVSAPTKTGYSFTGWQLSSGFDSSVARYGYNDECQEQVSSDGFIDVSRDVYIMNLTKTGEKLTMTAQWAPIIYNIEYDEKGGTPGAARATTVKYDEDLAVDPPTKVGYAFNGWSIDGFETGALYGLHTNACTRTVPSNGIIDKTVITTSSTLGTIYFKNLSSVSSKTVYLDAIWDAVVCDLAYNYDGGVGPTPANPSRLEYSKAVRIQAPTKDGYLFIGWKVVDCGVDARWGVPSATDVSAEVCTNSVPSDGIIEATGDIAVMNFRSSTSSATLTALWKKIPQMATVEFDGNGGTPSTNSVTYEVGEKYGELPTATIDDENKIFAGWWTLPTGGKEVTADTIVTTGVTKLYAHWTDLYIVVFNSNDGLDQKKEQKLPVGTATALETNAFTRTGYTFQGWAKEDDLTKVVYADGASVKDLAAASATINLYAVWKVNAYTVAFDENGGSGTMSSTSVTYGVSFALPACAFRPPEGNFKFGGWRLDGVTYEAGEVVSNLTAEADATVTLFAVWASTLTDLSRALDCDNLGWENAKPNSATQWAVTNGVGHGTSSCAYQQNTTVKDRSPLIAQLKVKNAACENGTLSFWWKPSSASAKLEYALSTQTTSYGTRTKIEAKGTDWQLASITVEQNVATSEAYYFVLFNTTATVDLNSYELVDQVSWVTEGSAGDSTGNSTSSSTSASVAPTAANAVKSLSATMASAGDAMTFSFTGDERFSYRVLYKDDLTDPKWSVLMTVSGTGGEQEVSVPRDASAPSRFYTIETIQK